MIHTENFGTKYYPVTTYDPGSDIVVYIRDPGPHTYYSYIDAGDGVPSPYHTSVYQESDGSWTAGFEDA
jgi:hypothetical protein